MLHILLLILKIIGILILAVLGLLLLAVLLVLFVPLRYQIAGSYYGAPKGSARITWLLHLLSITASYEGEPKITVRLAGFRLFGPKKERKLGRRAARKSRKAAKKLPRKVEKAAEPLAGEEKAVDKDARQVAEELHTPALVESDPESRYEPTVEENKAAPEPVTSGERPNVKREAEKEKPDSRTQTKEPKLPKPPGLGERLSFWWKSILEKLKNLWCTIKKICVKIRETKDSVNEYRDLLASPEWKRAWKLVKKEVRKLLRHLKPKKFTLTWRFGFEDPAVTGEVLAWLAMFYGFYYKHVTLMPVFDGDSGIQEGEFYCRGRIRAATLLIILAKLYFNKDIRFIRQKIEKEDEPDRETK